MKLAVPRASAFAFALVAALAAPACGGSSSPAQNQADATNEARASVDARLRGTWRLSDYRPEVPLEPMLGGLLALQMQTMSIRFESGRLKATSPTVQFDLPYRILEAGGPLFKIAANKDGADYQSSCQLSGDDNQIAFRAETEPWRGNGNLIRVSR